jgi:hypothetical protein
VGIELIIFIHFVIEMWEDFTLHTICWGIFLAALGIGLPIGGEKVAVCTLKSWSDDPNKIYFLRFKI